MREILFRAKTLDTGEWIHGFPVRASGIWYICAGKEDLSPAPRAHALMYTDLIRRAVDAETVGQFTGLTDRNGAKIFEGDVVSFGGENHAVSFADACFLITQESYAMELHTTIGQGALAVIGNIHDNPELLGNASLYNKRKF